MFGWDTHGPEQRSRRRPPIHERRRAGARRMGLQRQKQAYLRKAGQSGRAQRAPTLDTIDDDASNRGGSSAAEPPAYAPPAWAVRRAAHVKSRATGVRQKGTDVAVTAVSFATKLKRSKAGSGTSTEEVFGASDSDGPLTDHSIRDAASDGGAASPRDAATSLCAGGGTRPPDLLSPSSSGGEDTSFMERRKESYLARIGAKKLARDAEVATARLVAKYRPPRALAARAHARPPTDRRSPMITTARPCPPRRCPDRAPTAGSLSRAAPPHAARRSRPPPTAPPSTAVAVTWADRRASRPRTVASRGDNGGRSSTSRRMEAGRARGRRQWPCTDRPWHRRVLLRASCAPRNSPFFRNVSK